MNGWIKLHRKTLDNPIWKHDPTAWRVFEYFLMIVDHRTGSWDTGRYQLGLALDMKPTTAWMALCRLKKAKMVDIKSNNKYSTVSICKYKEYQSTVDIAVDNSLTSTCHQLDTKQELRIKNKEYIYTNLKITNEELENLKAQFPNKEVKVECDKADDWLANSSKRYKDFVAFMRGWLRRSESKVVSNVFVPPVTKPVSQEGLSRFASMKEKFGL